jgi:hypothetical protein
LICLVFREVKLPIRSGFKHAIDRSSTDLKLLGDLRGSKALSLQTPYLDRVNAWLAPTIDARCLGLGDAFRLPLAPWLVSNSANTPSISRKHLPAAVLVSIGCSMAFSAAPFAFSAPDDVLEVANAAREAVDAGGKRTSSEPHR